MGWFRPRRTVVDPLGHQWELYVWRSPPPGWHEIAGEGSGLAPATRFAVPLMLLTFPFALLEFVCASVVVPALRFLVALPLALIRGQRVNAVRIEAISFFPRRETRLWTTTPDQAGSVLEQVAAGLAEGRVVQPSGAVYSGSSSG